MSNWFNSLSSKVVAFFLVLTALSIVFLNALAFWSSNEAFRDQTLHAMQGTLTFRGDMLADLLTQVQNQAVSIAKIESLDQSITSLKSGWKTIVKNSGDAKAELQSVFVTNNPNGPDAREKLAKPEGPSGFYYSNHEKTHGEVASYLADTAFRDLLIADQDGNVIYSYKKGPVFAENLKDSRWAATGAGRAFAMSVEKAAAAKDENVPPSFSGLRVGADAVSPDIYFGVPLVKLSGMKGIILFQLKQEAISGLLAKGITAESDETSAFLGGDGAGVVLGADGKLADLAPGALPVTVPQTISAMPQIADFDSKDGPVRAYMRVIGFGDQKLAVVETIPLSELQAASISIAKVLMGSGAGVLVLMAVATLLLGRRLFAPLVQLASLTGEVANGRLDGKVTSQGRKDEIGSMARSLEQFRAALVEQRSLEAQNEEARGRAEYERRQRLAERDAEAKTLQIIVDTLDHGLQKLAAGDLAYRIETRFPDELEALRQNFNKALATLSETLAGIGLNSTAVREGSGEMRVGADQLAERTERQAASITETVTAIHAVTDAVRIQIAKAESAARIATEAKGDTIRSGEIMRETIAAMEAIQGSSQKINQIIGVIDEIAFQTNLLALNAGVEAARAGESGKGFAVVAQEVRELAQRSSTAAKEISDLLEKSTREVESGVGLVERAGRALEGIGSRVGEIDGQIADIMQSTRDEAQTLNEINRSIGGLDGMTQQNAAMVHQTTSAIHKLAKEATEMDQRLAQFVLAEKQAGHAGAGWRRAG